MSITHSRRPALLAVALANLALVGCHAADSGPSSTEDRPVGAFQSISLDGTARLDVLVGPAPSLSVIGSPQARAAFTTRVDGDRLVLESHNSPWQPGRGEVQVRVTVPRLRALTVGGAGEISVAGVSGDSLDLSLNGAASLEANGKVGTLAVQMNGAGKMDLSRLEAVDATVTTNGAGRIDINSTGSLVATVNGVGTINYYGKPAKVTTAINGVGSISPRNRDQ
jgi:Putative auto-transporter adhesin, head GIN domain